MMHEKPHTNEGKGVRSNVNRQTDAVNISKNNFVNSELGKDSNHSKSQIEELKEFMDECNEELKSVDYVNRNEAL